MLAYESMSKLASYALWRHEFLNYLSDRSYADHCEDACRHVSDLLDVDYKYSAVLAICVGLYLDTATSVARRFKLDDRIYVLVQNGSVLQKWCADMAIQIIARTNFDNKADFFYDTSSFENPNIEYSASTTFICPGVSLSVALSLPKDCSFHDMKDIVYGAVCVSAL